MKQQSGKVWTISLAAAVAFSGVSLMNAEQAGAPVFPAQAFRAKGEPVAPAPDGNFYCEAEEFKIEKPAQAGWQAKPWGENYYAATFANTFLSRKAFLGAPENCDETVASVTVSVPAAGRYLVLARYEAAYRFETQFKLKVEQGGKLLLDRLYGARKNIKIWAFGNKLKDEVCWDWGAVENIVWEGHDAYVELQAGAAKITLIAGKQPAPAAKRNVDLLLLTRDEAQVKERIEKEGYLPLDGMLTQAGDVYAKVIGGATVTLTSKWTEHSPYWVHLRKWQMPLVVQVGGNWVEIGAAMDCLNDGQWSLSASAPCKVAIGVKNAAGAIDTVKELNVAGATELIGLADLRYSRKVLTKAEGVAELLAYLNKMPVRGKAPSQTLVYAFFNIPELKPLYGLLACDLNPAGPAGKPTSYVDWRSLPPGPLEAKCKTYTDEQRKNIAVVSLGDEIGLPAPNAAAATEGFVAFLKAQGVTPKQVDPAAGDWAAIKYNPDPKLKQANPGLYYWSQRYLYNYGINSIKALTDVIRKYCPNAAIGANFSPHHGGTLHSYLGEVFKWVTSFREDGLTLPWAEDYVWQVPVGSPQMNGINLDLFRAGLRGKPNGKILYYVMPHWPGNTPAMWRRLFYQAVGHGAKILDWFEFNPVWTAYTENHVTNPEMYGAVLKGSRELGLFEDIVQAGQVRPATVGLWFSETGDIWEDNAGSFAAAKRALYVAVLGSQQPLDVVVDQDAASGALNSYKVLYLTDNHVAQAAAKKIAEWVAAGGKLFATAGAGMFDEYNQPNKVLRELLGVDQTALEAPAGAQVGYLKQDLPFTKEIGEVTLAAADKAGAPRTFPVFGVISRIKAGKDAEVKGKFKDGSPAVTVHKAGKGEAIYCAFLPGLSYFKPALPVKPVDRGSSDDAMAHFIPTEFDAGVGALVCLPVAGLKPPVSADRKYIEATVIESKVGTVITLINWTGKPIQGLNLIVSIPVPKKAELAGGGAVKVAQEKEATVFTLDLDLADALILR